MSAPDPRQIRRDAVERLAVAVRALADVAAETAIDPTEVDDVTLEIAALTGRLAAVTDDTPFSGLAWDPSDYSIPEGPMPLNPIIGACSPARPDVQLRFHDGEIVGRAMFTKRFVGPPGYAHGGISAMLADQIVAASALAVGLRPITKSLQIRYRRPLPLGEEIALWGVCEPTDGRFPARFTITARGEVAVDGTAELVSHDRLARRTE
jgi:acyl-coenzyme A thioesterase PaaI-like protein